MMSWERRNSLRKWGSTPAKSCTKRTRPHYTPHSHNTLTLLNRMSIQSLMQSPPCWCNCERVTANCTEWNSLYTGMCMYILRAFICTSMQVYVTCKCTYVTYDCMHSILYVCMRGDGGRECAYLCLYVAESNIEHILLQCSHIQLPGHPVHIHSSCKERS